MTDDRRPMTDDQSYDYEVQGEVIKLIHGELPAVRWTCGNCGEDACTIFYEPGTSDEVIECETCRARNLVRKSPVI
jgi:DNA-directed RNA polymerase subunit RPC12/RpoP